jgi:hypothetical protein
MEAIRKMPTLLSDAVIRMINEAASHVGYREGANNANMFSAYFGRPPEPWCADFVSYCATRAGLSMNTASAQRVQDIITQRGRWKGLSNPQPGDAVTFNWAGNRSGVADHVGLVEKTYTVNGTLYVQTIEGNKSDMVGRRQFPFNASFVKGYGVI